MTEPEVDWVPLHFRKWLAGTADLSGEAEFIFWRLTLLAYETQSAVLTRSPDRFARWCKIPLERFEIALAELLDAEKVQRTEGGLCLPSAEKHLTRAVGKLVNKQRGVAIARRSVELQKQGKGKDEIAQIIAAEFPDRKAADKPAKTPEPAPASKAVAIPTNTTETASAVELWNAVAVECGLSQVRDITPARQRSLKSRLAEIGGLAGWRSVLEAVRASDFLRGTNGQTWSVSFDWLLKPANLTKVREGTYENKQAKPNAKASALRGAFASQLEGQSNE